MDALLKDRPAYAAAGMLTAGADTAPAPSLPCLHDLPPGALLSRRQAAAYLGISEGTLAQWASTGRQAVPFFRVGSLTKYRRADLDSYIAARRRVA